MAVAVENLAVLGEDGGEADTPALREGQAFHIAHDLLLDAARADAAAGDGVHLEAEVAGGVDARDLALILDEAHLDDGAHQRLGSLGAAGFARAHGLLGPEPEQLGEQQLVVVAGSGQEMHLTALQRRREGVVRGGVRHAHAVCQRADGGHGAHPDDIVEAEVVGIDRLLPRLQVDRGREARLVDAEEIEPVTVLAPFVAVVSVLGGRFHIPEEEGDAPLSFHALQQLLTTRDIDLFFKHSKDKDSNFPRIPDFLA